MIDAVAAKHKKVNAVCFMGEFQDKILPSAGGLHKFFIGK
jgi:hypothetical protein